MIRASKSFLWTKSFPWIASLVSISLATPALSLAVFSTGTGTRVEQTQPVELSSSAAAQSVPLNFDFSSLSFSDRSAVLPSVTGGEGTGGFSFSTSGPCTTDGVSVTATGTGDCVITVTKGGDDNYLPISASQTYTITSADYRIIQPDFLNFDLSSISFSNRNASLPPATGGTGTGAISYQASGACTTDGSTITATGTGDCSITATKAGDDDYLSQLSLSIYTITDADYKIPQPDALVLDTASVSFTNRNASLPQAIGGTGTGAITYTASGACTTDGTTITTTAIGACTITTTKAGDTDYLPQTTTSSITITSSDHLIPQPDPLVFDIAGLSFSNRAAPLPAATGGTGTGGLSYTASGNCTTNGSVITATSAGLCTVTAVKAGDSDYLPQTTASVYTIATVDYQIAQAPMALDLSGLTFTNQTAALPAPTGGSGTGALTYSTNANCSITNNIITAIGLGDCVITATRAADDGYTEASVTSTVALAASVFPPAPDPISIAGGAAAVLHGAQGGAGVVRPLTVTGGVPPFEWRIRYVNNGGGESQWISLSSSSTQITLDQTENQACGSGSVARFTLILDPDNHRNATVNLSWSTLNDVGASGCVQIWQGFEARDSLGSQSGSAYYNLINP